MNFAFIPCLGGYIIVNTSSMQSFSVILQAVLPVFLVIGIGGFLHRQGWFAQQLDRGIFNIVMNLLTPCFIFDSILGNDSLRLPQNIIAAPIIGFLFCTLCALVGLALAPLIGLRERPSQRAFSYALSIMNYGYIAVPLAQSIFGKETLGMLFVFNLGVEIALWTLGAILLSHQPFSKSFRQINFAVILAIVLGLILNFAHAHEWLPLFLRTTIHLLGAPAIPLAILLIGATFSASLHSFSFHEGWKTIGSGLLFRNFIFPLALIVIAKYLPLSDDLRRVIILQGAMPAALYPIVLIKHYHGDALTGLRVAIPTNLLGLLTIPLILKFGMGWVFG